MKARPLTTTLRRAVELAPLLEAFLPAPSRWALCTPPPPQTNSAVLSDGAFGGSCPPRIPGGPRAGPRADLSSRDYLTLPGPHNPTLSSSAVTVEEQRIKAKELVKHFQRLSEGRQAEESQ